VWRASNSLYNYPVVVGAENGLAIVTPLGDVVSYTRNDDSRTARH
jgi:hypothetical protein